MKIQVCERHLGSTPLIQQVVRIQQIMEAISVVIVLLQQIHIIYEDKKFNDEQCKSLLLHCADLSVPIKQLQDNHDLINSNSAALTSVLNLLVDCRKHCEKFKNRNFIRTFSHHNRDKEKFITFHRKIDSAVASFNLQLATNIHLNVAQAQRSAKEEHDRTQLMLMQLLAASGRQEEFLRLPSKDRRGFLERARQMSDNLTDLGSFDVDEVEKTNADSTRDLSGGSRQTKLSVFNSLIEDIDFAVLKHWNVAAAEPTNPKRLIGQGTFGKVYRVEYEGREVALKHFPCLTSTSMENRPSDREIRAIKKEACTLQYCSKHENVIGFLGVSMEKGIILMEIAVCSLFCILYGTPEFLTTLPAGVNVPELKTFHYKSSIVLDIASALHFLHFHKIMHRDIKSCNVVMVASAPRAAFSASNDSTNSPRASTILVPKLSDFGLATAVGSATKTAPALSAVGSTAYMSPEILDYSGKLPPYTPAVDIFALGVLANEIYTEAVPWQGHREAGIISKVVFQDQRSEPVFRPDEPPTSLAYRVAHEVIGDASKGCLHQDPRKRPSAKELSYDWELLRLAAMPPSASASRSHSPIPGLASQSSDTLGTPRLNANTNNTTASCRGLGGGAANAAKLSAAIESTLAEQYDIATERASYFEELTSAFASELANFEVFAFDAVDIISSDLHHVNAADVFVTQVLKPLHEVTHKYVTDKMKDAVYHHSPALLLSEIAALNDVYVHRLMVNMGTEVTDLHTAMLNADTGFITPAEQSLRLPQLVRIMLRMHALAVVAQPRCCLAPTPGVRVHHKKDHFHEIMNPGSSRVFGMLQDNDFVQVVRSGLYLEGATSVDTLSNQPLTQSWVRRLNIARAASSKYSIAHGGIKSDFEATFVNFESFAMDASNTLEETYPHNAEDLLVSVIMVPIFQTTLRYVTEKRKDPKYNAEPHLLLLDLADLDDAAIFGLMDKMGTKVPLLATAMVNAAARGAISDEMRIPQLVRHFLRLHASVLLSASPCWLTPSPGERITFQFAHCTEVLSPGVKTAGKIKEGVEVEVVLCGLTFDLGAEPVVKCLVRRILPNLFANNFTNNILISPADVRAEFDVDYAGFELFCHDCMDCLEEMQIEQEGDFLCPNILTPLITIAKNYIAERVAKGQLRLQELASLDEDAINGLLATAGPVVNQLHQVMLRATEANIIEADGLRLPVLLRSLLRSHALVALSQPMVYLHPPPGSFITYREGYCVEICSPGARIFGRIKEGARVEVMLFGLYLEDPLQGESVRPAVPCLVRRLIQADANTSNT